MAKFRLADLEPQFIRYETRDTSPTFDGETQPREILSEFIVPVRTLDEAQGIQLLCPKCYLKNKGKVGTHLIQVTFAGRGVLDSQGAHNSKGNPARWKVFGSTIADLSTDPSILIEGSCAWHGWIRNGEVTL